MLLDAVDYSVLLLITVLLLIIVLQLIAIITAVIAVNSIQLIINYWWLLYDCDRNLIYCIDIEEAEYVRLDWVCIQLALAQRWFRSADN